jgi:hypothetical protein
MLLCVRPFLLCNSILYDSAVMFNVLSVDLQCGILHCWIDSRGYGTTRPRLRRIVWRRRSSPPSSARRPSLVHDPFSTICSSHWCVDCGNLQLTALGLRYVLQSLTPNHRNILILLAKAQLGSPEGSVSFNKSHFSYLGLLRSCF